MEDLWLVFTCGQVAVAASVEKSSKGKTQDKKAAGKGAKADRKAAEAPLAKEENDKEVHT